MISLFRKRKKAPSHALDFAPQLLAKWKEEDRGALRTFLHSPTGQRLRQRLHDGEALMALTAIEETPTPYAAGRASGFRAALFCIFQLSGDVDPQSAHTAEANKGTGEPSDTSDFDAEYDALRNQLQH